VIAALREVDSKPVVAMLERAEPSALEGDGTQLVVALQDAPLLDRLSDPKNLKTLTLALRKVFKATLKVRVVVRRSMEADAPRSDEVADFVQRVGAKRVSGAEASD